MSYSLGESRSWNRRKDLAFRKLFRDKVRQPFEADARYGQCQPGKADVQNAKSTLNRS